MSSTSLYYTTMLTIRYISEIYDSTDITLQQINYANGSELISI